MLSQEDRTPDEHPVEPDDETVRRELSKSEQEMLRRIDPGVRGIVIPAVMLVLMLSSILPWIGGATGWQVLVQRADPALDVGLLPWLFAVNSTIVGLGLGALALVTRRWAVAFLAALGAGVVSFEGIIAIWSRQTSPEAGPSIGLILAVLSMIVLAAQWLRIAWSRD